MRVRLGDGYVIAQAYLPAAVEGDTRLFLMNGLPFRYKGKYAAFRRVRTGDDMRAGSQFGGLARLWKGPSIPQSSLARLIPTSLYSALSSRSISPRTASVGERPSYSTAYICSVIAISTPFCRARSRAAAVVLTPSATIFIDFRISSSFRPRPSSTPTR